MVDTPHISPFLIEYPESDGQPMSESDATRNYLIYCVAALQRFFQGRPQVYASGNLFIYYQEGHPEKSLSPDVFVIFGVSKRQRRSYKVWQEGGKLPDFVLEITSMTTRKQDEDVKPKLYASLGIREYFQYDPTGDYLTPQLKGRRLVDGEYQPIPAVTLPDGAVSIHSETLGLDLRLLPLSSLQTSLNPSGLVPVARELRLYDPQTNSRLLTHEESEQARLEAEQAKLEAEQAVSAERQRAEQAEQRLQQLLEQLRSQGISDLPNLDSE